MVTRRRASRLRADAGLTLVELMVTLVIASLVASSTFVFFAGQQRIYETQTKILNVQQNVWASMEMLARYVRAAGSGMSGCVRADSDGAGPDTGDPVPVGATAPLTGLRAWRNGEGVVRIPPIWITNGAAGAPDSVAVAFGAGAFGNFSDTTVRDTIPAESPLAALKTPVGLSAMFRANEFIVLVDTALNPTSGNGDRGCTLFQITGIGADDELVRAATSSWNPAAPAAGLMPWAYTGGATPTGGIRNFGQLNWVQFSIAPATATTPPRLMMNRLDTNMGAQVLAEGIEDLQVAYACDVAPTDGTLSEGATVAARGADEWVLNSSGEAVPANCNRPQAVRITLIARSLTEDDTLVSLTANRKPAVEDGVAGAQDRFRHRVITTTVFPRN